jgi:hypothetical protein
VLEIMLYAGGDEVRGGSSRYQAVTRLAGFGLAEALTRPYERDVHGDVRARFALTEGGRAALRLERAYRAEDRVEARRPAPPRSSVSSFAAGAAAAVLLMTGGGFLWRTLDLGVAGADLALIASPAPASFSGSERVAEPVVFRE